jgi:beta-xylosidase
MINATDGNPVERGTVPLNQKGVYLKAECDFTNKKDVADFYYSLDGKTWTPVGTQLKMAYTIPHFMGYRFVLFNYATKSTGGYADFDFFRIEDKLGRKP